MVSTHSSAFANYLEQLLMRYEVNRAQLAKKMRVSKSYLSEILVGRSKPFTMERCEQASDIIGVNAEERRRLKHFSMLERAPKEVRLVLEKTLMAKTSIINLTEDLADYVKIPLLGRCPASKKEWVVDEVEVYHYLPKQIVRGRRLYLLKAKGDSMNKAGIDDGDLLLVHADGQPDNGNIVIMCVDHEYTVKRFYKNGLIVTLMPDSTNPAHSPMTFNMEKCEMHLRGTVEAIHMKRLK